MRSYEEQEKRAYEKAELLAEKKRRKAMFIRRGAAIGLGAAAVLGIGIFTNAMKPPKRPVEESGIISETAETTASAVTTTEHEPIGTAEISTASAESTASASDTSVTAKTTAVSEKTQTSKSGKTTAAVSDKKQSKTTAKTSAVSTAKTQRTTSKTSRTSPAATRKTTAHTTAVRTITTRRTTLTEQPTNTQSAQTTSNTKPHFPGTSTTASFGIEHQYKDLTWTVTAVSDDINKVSGKKYPQTFDYTAKNAESIISGTVTDVTGYTVEYTNEYNERIAKRCTVLEVEVNEVYYGSSADAVKIYYPYPAEDLYDNTFLFRKGREYIFCLYKFSYVYPDRHLSPEQYADAFIWTANTEAAPVIEGKVFFDSRYINVSRQGVSTPKTLPLSSVYDIIPEEIRGGDWFSCLEKDDYIKYILKLFGSYR